MSHANIAPLSVSCQLNMHQVCIQVSHTKVLKDLERMKDHSNDLLGIPKHNDHGIFIQANAFSLRSRKCEEQIMNVALHVPYCIKRRTISDIHTSTINNKTSLYPLLMGILPFNSLL